MPDTKTAIVEGNNYQHFTQFECTQGNRPPVYLVLSGEMESDQVALFEHQDIMSKIIEIFTRDAYDISSPLLPTNGKALAISLGLSLEAEVAVMNNDKDRALRFLVAADWLSQSFIAIGDVPFITEEGTMPYTRSYRMESWMQEMQRAAIVH